VIAASGWDFNNQCPMGRSIAFPWSNIITLATITSLDFYRYYMPFMFNFFPVAVTDFDLLCKFQRIKVARNENINTTIKLWLRRDNEQRMNEQPIDQ
jgi:hypothetical protein